jgi:hypothetical protein
MIFKSCIVNYEGIRFKCSANVIVPVHATNSIGVSTGSTFVVIGCRTSQLFSASLPAYVA